MNLQNYERHAPLTSPAAKSFAAQLTALCVSILTLLTLISWKIYRATLSPVKRPIFDLADRGNDLLNYAGKIRHVLFASHVIGSGVPVYNYPAPSAYVYWVLLNCLPGHRYFTYMLISSAVICGLVLLTFKIFGRSAMFIAAGVAIFLMVSEPILFVLDRGNLEIFVWILTLSSVVTLLFKRAGLAAFLLGLAMALKPFPVLLIFLFVRLRMYKQALAACVISGVVMLIALVGLGPNPLNAYRDLRPGVNFYLQQYVVLPMPTNESRFEHSLMDAAKIAALVTQVHSPTTASLGVAVSHIRAEATEKQEPWRFGHPLLLLCMFIGLVLVGYSIYRLWTLPIVNVIIALSVLITLIPPVSAEYTLLVLLLPLGILLYSAAFGKPKEGSDHRKFYVLASVLLALLLSPLTFLGVWNGPAKCVLLLALLAVALMQPFQHLPQED